MPRSEKAAWLMVKELATDIHQLANSRGRTIDQGRLSVDAEDLLKEADVMLAQLARGVHENPARRKNPALIVWPNPGSSLHVTPFKILSHRVISLAYKHQADGHDYEHDFRAGVDMVCGTLDNDQRVVVLTRPDGREVWELF